MTCSLPMNVQILRDYVIAGDAAKAIGPITRRGPRTGRAGLTALRSRRVPQSGVWPGQGRPAGRGAGDVEAGRGPVQRSGSSKDFARGAMRWEAAGSGGAPLPVLDADSELDCCHLAASVRVCRRTRPASARPGCRPSSPSPRSRCARRPHSASHRAREVSAGTPIPAAVTRQALARDGSTGVAAAARACLPAAGRRYPAARASPAAATRPAAAGLGFRSGRRSRRRRDRRR